MEKGTVRRSITIPNYLDQKISLIFDEYSYSTKNTLFVELLELGILKFNEDIDNKQLMYMLIDKINFLINKLENK